MGNEYGSIIKSVGIDIGTTTTQIVISQLVVKNVAPGTLIPRMQITDKEILYRSNIYFTPIKDGYLIDAQKISEIVRSEYQKAGVAVEEIDTGAVIITGETAKKENAKSILQQIAKFAGDFVVATAGGNLESIIAGKGSGAADYSKNNYCTVANIDIGGGTSNIAIFKNGKAIDSCCINVGGRLIQIDRETEKISLISNPMKMILADSNIDLKVGDKVSSNSFKSICEKLARILIESISLMELSNLAKKLMMTEQLKNIYEIDKVMISGGVADYVYTGNKPLIEKDVFQFGDIGPLLGQEVKNAFEKSKFTLVEPLETIRATVIGAGARTVDVSGSTIIVADSILPLKNVPVMKPFSDDFTIDEKNVAQAVSKTLNSYFNEDSIENIAVAIQGVKLFSFLEIQALARGLLTGLEKIIKLGLPIIIVTEQDCAKVLGQTIKSIINQDNIVCIDQIEVNEGDYIDIGKSIAGGTVVPVIIKTLIFESKQT
jgi:ethanolamine utilization protein EutA